MGQEWSGTYSNRNQFADNLSRLIEKFFKFLAGILV